MEHIETLKGFDHGVSKKLINSSTGKYYTHVFVAKHLITAIIKQISKNTKLNQEIKVVDPFAGDGRLIELLIYAWKDADLPPINWQVELWDINTTGLMVAKEKMEALKKKGFLITYKIKNTDAFKASQDLKNNFDIVITNPPWELLKPDSRELKELSAVSKKEYIASVKSYDYYLSFNFPLAQPTKKFAGWGTNLSRVGLELSHSICKVGGYVAIIIPASFFADDQSTRLRSEILKNYFFFDIAFFPAEAKVFDSADVNSSTFAYQKILKQTSRTYISVYDANLKLASANDVEVTLNRCYSETYTIPIAFSTAANEVFNKINKMMSPWSSNEKKSKGLWSGREIDETGRANWLTDQTVGPPFIKGDMISRYRIVKQPDKFIKKENWSPPSSSMFERIGWRDVSRTSQKRRIVATIIPAGFVAGNSINVAFFKDNNHFATKTLLGIVNSLCFEFQLRQHLGTGHISLSSVRKVCIPSKEELVNSLGLYNLICLLEQQKIDEFVLEAYIAKKVYKLTEEEFDVIISIFKKISTIERELLLSEYKKCH